MQFVCDAPDGKTWFRIETEAEASAESDLMQHAVYKHFCRKREEASLSFKPASRAFIEQEIGRDAHIQRAMPMFLTLRDREGAGLVTAMLPPQAPMAPLFTPLVVGVGNADPFVEHAAAIKALGERFGITLDRQRCYPYGR
ncbi:MAG: hypothetical protein JWN93_1215 [Hyphomicrobiales bacterium]|nr:hypothetical protein [Hyphomicrobiales bacterium]